MAYKYVKRKGHILLAGTDIRLPLHRLVLFNKIGYGPHLCHHCGVHINWLPGKRTSLGALVTDHLDEDITNNDPENLVPSCHGCNHSRWHRIKKDELFVIHTGTGRRVRAVEKVCETCTRPFLIAQTQLKSRPGREGKYCSLECLWARDR